MTKTCFKCGNDKPLSEFYVHPSMADGRLNKCVDCAKKDMRQRRLTHPEKTRAYDRLRAKTPERAQDRHSRNIRYVSDNPEKRAAHMAVANALKSGKIQRLPCAFCRTPDNLEAHHHDYAKPLDVTWLCRPCHRRFHALERMATYRDAA